MSGGRGNVDGGSTVSTSVRREAERGRRVTTNARTRRMTHEKGERGGHAPRGAGRLPLVIQEKSLLRFSKSVRRRSCRNEWMHALSLRGAYREDRKIC
jgi:hypothetical protein